MSTVEKAVKKYVDYPESDGKPMGETDWHRDLIMELILTLRFFFRQKKNVYVSGNLMMYYVEGEPAKVISPDVFVVFGVSKGERRIWKTWEEGHAPDVVIEISSRKTWKEDFDKKMRIYAELGVREYFIFDPEYPRNRRAFNAYCLSGGKYIELPIANGRVKIKVLGLELVDTGETLRLFHPRTKKFLPTEIERVEALQKAEAEVARLRAELESLRKKR